MHAGRAVLSTVTYRVHKDVLSDLVHRYQQVLRVHEQGGGASAASAASAPFSLSPEHHWVVRVSFGLCFPRVALAWLWLTGQAIPPRNACCHQECHWEEMLRVRRPRHASLTSALPTPSLASADADSHTHLRALANTPPPPLQARAKPPTLQSLLARAAATRPTPPSLFAPPPSAPQQAGASSAPWAQPHQQPGCAAGRAGAAAGGGALARWREQVRQPGWRPAPWAWALARNVTWGDAARAACALVAPSMLVAHDALEVRGGAHGPPFPSLLCAPTAPQAAADPAVRGRLLPRRPAPQRRTARRAASRRWRCSSSCWRRCCARRSSCTPFGASPTTGCSTLATASCRWRPRACSAASPWWCWRCWRPPGCPCCTRRAWRCCCACSLWRCRCWARCCCTSPGAPRPLAWLSRKLVGSRCWVALAASLSERLAIVAVGLFPRCREVQSRRRNRCRRAPPM